ncbi:hypothetical protein SAMN05428997_1037 [Bosea sp. CRIB-10]|uniref:hypothetical protein n=1 Tax=Bosea sp. CRIB-10 TaxID=378404 RepID=UPI0008E4C634|nr:hypothetical protein [Bosea sp. CRIB-10]SFB92410.1 hypothetical protein SAMN05428997_1037 [Bosea sp. CRIB-10]
MYQRVNLAATAVDGPTGPLPPELAGLDDASLADLSWVGAPLDALYGGYGYWPLEISDPDFDPATETLTDDLTDVTPVAGRKVATAKRSKRALTAEEIAARQPRPHVLSKMQFIRLVQTAGGVTDALLVQADAEPLLKPFWVKFTMTTEMQRDDVDTQAGLGALAALGLLPNGTQAILDAWPTG